MPVMDGSEFCRNLKQDFETSHIPVILLTAKSSIESQVEGLNNGGDDYVANLYERPFTEEEMIYRPDIDINKAERDKEAAKGERIVTEETMKFRQWLDGMEVTPTIVAPAGTSSITTAFAPTRARSPSVIGPMICAPEPMITLSLIVG